MTRCYIDPIDVRVACSSDGGAPAGGSAVLAEVQPQQFIWRRRLYVVRSVLSAWIEVGVWWPAALPAAVGAAGGVPSEPAPDPEGEYLVWRVEAAAGRFSPLGVYDLCRDPRQRWLLVRSLD